MQGSGLSQQGDIGPARWLIALAFVSVAHVLTVDWLASQRAASVPPSAGLVVEAILLPADAPPAPDVNVSRAEDLPPTFEPVREPREEPEPVPEPEPEPPPVKEPEPEPSPPADSVPLAMPEAPSPKAPPRRAAKARTTVAPAAARRDRRAEDAGAPAGGTSGLALRTAATGPRYDAAYLSNPAPSYPMAARRRNLQGRVLVYAVVGPGGDCARAEVRKTSGHPILDEAALQAVRAWRFVPATRDGRPVTEGVEIPIVFRLEG